MANESVSIRPMAVRVDSTPDLHMMLRPLRSEFEAHVVFTEEGHPQFQPDDVLIADLRVTRYDGDSMYVVEIDGKEKVRYIQARSDGLHAYFAPGIDDVQWDDSRMRFLAVVREYASFRVFE